MATPTPTSETAPATDTETQAQASNESATEETVADGGASVEPELAETDLQSGIDQPSKETEPVIEPEPVVAPVATDVAGVDANPETEEQEAVAVHPDELPLWEAKEISEDVVKLVDPAGWHTATVSADGTVRIRFLANSSLANRPNADWWDAEDRFLSGIKLDDLIIRLTELRAEALHAFAADQGKDLTDEQIANSYGRFAELVASLEQ